MSQIACIMCALYALWCCIFIMVIRVNREIFECYTLSTSQWLPHCKSQAKTKKKEKKPPIFFACGGLKGALRARPQIRGPIQNTHPRQSSRGPAFLLVASDVHVALWMCHIYVRGYTGYGVRMVRGARR